MSALPASVDLNADVGEATDADGIATEHALFSLVTSVNVACGGHAGDERSMRLTAQAALDCGVRVGAHPSYPDREGFGRRPLAIEANQLEASVRQQLTALADICASLGTTLHSVKPHGALYREAARAGGAFDALRAAMAGSCGPDTALVLPAGSPAVGLCRAEGMAVRAEGFCDRAYAPDGTLVDRTASGAVFTDPGQAARQAIDLARAGSVDTLCIHGDSPGAVAMAAAVRQALFDAGDRGDGTIVTRSIPVGETRPLGDRALLIGVEDAGAGRTLVRELNAALGAWVDDGNCEVVGGLATVMVVARDAHIAEQIEAVAVAAAAARASAGASEQRETGELVTIPCVFDGPDLDEVAEHCGLARSSVVERLTAQPLTVAMLGFSPGFAFLGGLPEDLATVPRRERPRTAVAAGSVALANGYAAVYPAASPGGWRLVGRTNDTMFSVSEPPYARLAAGDRVQFAAVDERDLAPVRQSVPAVFERPTKSRHLFSVVTPGLRTVLQDGGRIGVASIGVPEAGPADPHSFALASRLVGNSAKRAALEITGQGPTLRVEGSGYVTAVGGSPQVRLDDQAVVAGQVVPVRPGQELAIGAVRPGLRTYLAAAGGFVAPRLFGSVAADQLSGLGPDPLRAGDALFVETMIPPLADHLDHLPGTHDEGGAVHLRVTAGPHHEWFEPDALARLAEATFVVAPESNRVGLRLNAVGELPTLRAGQAQGRELDSQGMVHGAVQVPPDGGPVILMSDHATHGGYPVVAVVITADLGRLGQCAPGDPVTLTAVDLATARLERSTQRRVFDRAVIGYYPLAVE